MIKNFIQKTKDVSLSLSIAILIILLFLSIPLLDYFRTKTGETLLSAEKCYANDAFFSLNLNKIVVNCYHLDRFGDVLSKDTCIIDVINKKIIECK